MGTGLEWGMFGATVFVFGALMGGSWFAGSQHSSIKISLDTLTNSMKDLNTKFDRTKLDLNTKMKTSKDELNMNMDRMERLLLDQNLAIVERMSYVEGHTQSPRFKDTKRRKYYRLSTRG